MNNNVFKIKILRQHWIKDDGENDIEDLCSHGELFLQIGNKVLSDTESGSWTLSATGLYLLRTLNIDYSKGDFDNQLIPCCGHMIIPSDDKNYVTIWGCPEGIDFSIKHNNGNVIITYKKEIKAITSFENYKTQILDLTDEIEIFYGDPNKKDVPKDEFEQKGFKQFWSEWTELKTKWKNTVHNTISYVKPFR